MVNYNNNVLAGPAMRPVKESGVIYRGRVGLAAMIDAKFIPCKIVVRKIPEPI